MKSVASHPKRRVLVVHLKTVGRIIYKTDDIMSLVVLFAGVVTDSASIQQGPWNHYTPFSAAPGATERDGGGGSVNIERLNK